MTLTYYVATKPQPSPYTFTNQPDRYRSYNGVEFALVKRFADRWMGNVSFAYAAHHPLRCAGELVETPGQTGHPVLLVDRRAYGPACRHREPLTFLETAFIACPWRSASVVTRLVVGFRRRERRGAECLTATAGSSARSLIPRQSADGYPAFELDSWVDRQPPTQPAPPLRGIPFASPVRVPSQFADRREAGRQLAAALERFKRTDAVVLGLPRGGVPVAYEIALALELPLGVYIVRKLGVPGHRELAMGAIASGGTRVMDEELIEELRIPEAAIDAVVAEEERELAARERLFGTAAPTPLVGRTVILVDDGLATGSTMRAAVRAVRQQQPSTIVVAAPVGAPSTCRSLEDEADEVVCLRTPEPFSAVGLWYRRFDQTPDEEVRSLLADARRRQLPS